jgi:flagellar hook-basal body complex protein FliE
MSAMPGMRPGGMPGIGGGDDALAKIIPKDELAKLEKTSPSVLQPNVGGGVPNIGSIGDTRGASFSNVLGNMINEVSAKQTEAGAAMKGVVSGNGVQLHQAMIAVEEASVSFQLMVEVRNRLLESYQELMRMQV